MKKRYLFLFTLLFLLFLPFNNSYATTKSYTIDDVAIKAVLNPDGTLSVTETLTYNFQGDFNGVFRDYPLTNNCSYTINSVSITDEKGTSSNPTLMDSEENNTYQLIDDGSNIRVKIFTKSINETKKVTLNYTVINPALYLSNENVSTLNWSFYSVLDSTTVNKISLDFSLKNFELSPENSSYEGIVANDNTLNYSTEYSNGHILANTEDLISDFGIKLNIPSDYFTISIPNDISEDIPYDIPEDIPYVVTPYYEPYNNQTSSMGLGMFVIIIIATVITTIIIVVTKNNNEYNAAVKAYRDEVFIDINPIYFEAPSDLPPALVNMLINNGPLSNNMLSSTLFYLVCEGYYTVSQINTTSEFFKIENKDLKFTLNNLGTAPKEEHLKYFISWFNKYSKNGSFSLLDIKKNLQRNSFCKSFIVNENKWKELVTKDANNMNMFVTIKNKKILSNNAVMEKYKWLSYKNHLINSIQNLHSTKIEFDINKSLVYALALDISKKHINSFNTHLKNININNYSTDIDPTLTYLYSDLLINMSLINDTTINHSTSTTFDSGGGFTGFSGGGDCGGGGGGGAF